MTVGDAVDHKDAVRADPLQARDSVLQSKKVRSCSLAVDTDWRDQQFSGLMSRSDAIS